MRESILRDEAKVDSNIGRRIRDARMQCGLTQEELAEFVELTPSYVSHIETANKKISMSTAIKLAHALSVSLDWLVLGAAPVTQKSILPEAQKLFEDCSVKEQRALLEVMKVVKNVLRTN